MEKSLDAEIGGAQVLPEELIFLAVAAQQRAYCLQERGSGACGGLAERG
jgi:hypothetical protein